ncbi:MAG: SCO family protein [Anaerolineae bacterium]
MVLSRSIRRVTVLAAILIMVVGCDALTPAPTPTPELVSVIDPPVQIANFTLTDQYGNPAHLSDYSGKLVLLAFGYTHCPDVCPVTLAHFKLVKMILGDQAAKVAFLFISVDGKRDTPTRLKEYLPSFDASFVGVMGTDATVRAIITEFGGTYTLNDGGGLRIEYTVDHTAASFALDGSGKVDSQVRLRYRT